MKNKLLFFAAAAIIAATLGGCAGGTEKSVATTSASGTGNSSYAASAGTGGAASAPAAEVSSKAPAPSVDTATAEPKEMQKALAMSDGQLADDLAGLDLCLCDNLLFTDAKQIPSETLYTFFNYVVSGSDIYPKNYADKWFDKSKNVYVIPAAEVEKVIGAYFEDAKFEPAKLPKVYGYDPQRQVFVNEMIGGFGGGRFPKIAQKQIVSPDTLKITVDYFDQNYKTVEYTKVYTIRYSNTGYKYLSIVKNPAITTSADTAAAKV